jgi:acyl-coenzyme A thioesterase 13
MRQLPPGYTKYEYDDPFEDLVGPLGYRVVNGALSLVFEVGPQHCNSQATVHGGMLMTFADYALCLAATWDQPGEKCLTISINCEFTAPGKQGDVVESTAEVIRRTGSFAFVRGLVFVKDRTLLNYSGIVKRLRPTP